MWPFQQTINRTWTVLYRVVCVAVSIRAHTKWDFMHSLDVRVVVNAIGNSRRCTSVIISFCTGLTNTSPIPIPVPRCAKPYIADGLTVMVAWGCRRRQRRRQHTPPPPSLSVIQPYQNLPNALHTSPVSSHILLYLCLRARVVNFPLLFALHRTIMAVVKPPRTLNSGIAVEEQVDRPDIIVRGFSRVMGY